GAATVYTAGVAGADALLVTPQVAALAAAAAVANPSAVLVGSTPDSREAGTRLAVRTGGAYLADVIGLDANGTVTQSAFGGAYTVTASAAKGIPVISLRSNSIDGAAAAASGTVVELDVAGDSAPTTAITARHEATA